ncbi:peptide ABC transporter [Deinococcus metallilatus]|uniref:D-amino peptidase n=1 Tax=Deinococcus metallilatus TaxID=1211322 RepID=A0AAJ5F5K5_9DEIO|nr:M55 family metallopeptidase [Deinococcus metallilatus]MBB5294041.1 D-amino peptidase [Deinococcus metallilatus]QBY08832.1 peptide ABC transporter [Deinococcus metallilatus]RXJ09976.1 peptide ABC transporter [Deinococcus metallilatus]TLK28087.1 peptide ABC transporter [Deinococcus metallilatus]GMA16624.1 peptide ABC transporter [Deinococcus metallilatus]
MKVVISVDMEGVCGVASWVQVSPPEFGGLVNAAEYQAARERMTLEAAAAAEGAFAGGATAVLVNDSHDTMRNLLPELLPEGVRFTSGNDKPLSMVQGVQEEGVGALLFVGYHARAGSVRGPLAHTWNGFIRNVRVNGRDTGEYGLNALVAGHYGVPVVFAAGDDVAMAEIQDELGEQVVCVAVKEGLSSFAALHLHPREAQRLIREGAEKAVRAAQDAKPYKTLWPARVELSFNHQARADQAGRVPGVERVDGVTVAYTSPDALHLFQSFRMLSKVAEVRLEG